MTTAPGRHTTGGMNGSGGDAERASLGRAASRPAPDPSAPSRAMYPFAPFPTAAYRLSGVLLVITCVASGLTFADHGILTGPAAMNGSARGTALVLLAVTAPVMAAAMVLAARGSVRAIVVWLGALASVLYNAQMLLYATPFNRLFLTYVAMLGLAVWSIILLLRHRAVTQLAARIDDGMPIRAIATYTMIIAVLNTLIWLRTIVPALLADTPSSFLQGMGLTTSPTFIQDLAWWLPLMIVGSVWLLRRRPWGYLLVGALLVTWVLEGASIAADQWFAYQADPASPEASLAMVPAFAALAVVTLLPLYFFLRHVSPVPVGRGDHGVQRG